MDWQTVKDHRFTTKRFADSLRDVRSIEEIDAAQVALAEY